MKKIIFCISIFAVVLFTACHEDQYKNNDTTQRDFLDIKNPGVTQHDIVRIATKYGLQDSVAQGYKCHFFTLPESGAYPYMDPIYIDSFLASQARAIKSWHEYQIFDTGKLSVKSVNEFFELREKIPSLHAFDLKSHGGDKEYQKYKEDMAQKCDIYLDEENVIVFSLKGDPFEYGRKLNKD